MRKILKLREVGNATIVTIPKEMAESLGWQPGDEVCVSDSDSQAQTLTVEFERRPAVRETGK